MDLYSSWKRFCSYATRISSFLGLSPISRPYWTSFLGLGAVALAGSVETRLALTIRSKSEAEISSLKDDDLSSAAESSPVSSQNRSWIGANRIFMLYLHLRRVWWRNMDMVRMTINLSIRWRVEIIDLEVVVGSTLRARGGLTCWVPTAALLCMLVRNLSNFSLYKKEIDSHFTHRRSHDSSEISGAKTQLFVWLGPIPTRPSLLHFFSVYKPHLWVFASPSFPTIRWSTRHFTCQLQQFGCD